MRLFYVHTLLFWKNKEKEKKMPRLLQDLAGTFTVAFETVIIERNFNVILFWRGRGGSNFSLILNAGLLLSFLSDFVEAPPTINHNQHHPDSLSTK